jgi:hypothetical protein
MLFFGEKELPIPEPYLSAHKDAGPGNKHRERILASSLVGCFYCLCIYPPAEIYEWVEGGCTALCAHCGIDSVLPEMDGKYAADFLKWMNHYWFNNVSTNR